MIMLCFSKSCIGLILILSMVSATMLTSCGTKDPEVQAKYQFLQEIQSIQEEINKEGENFENDVKKLTAKFVASGGDDIPNYMNALAEQYDEMAAVYGRAHLRLDDYDLPSQTELRTYAGNQQQAWIIAQVNYGVCASVHRHPEYEYINNRVAIDYRYRQFDANRSQG